MNNNLENLSKERFDYFIEGIKKFYPELYRFYFDKNYTLDVTSDSFLYNGETITKSQFESELKNFTLAENIGDAVQEFFNANQESEKPNKPADVPVNLEELVELDKKRAQKRAQIDSSRERQQGQVRTWIKNKSEEYRTPTPEDIARRANNLGTIRPTNFDKDIPNEVYFKPKSDDFVETQTLTVTEAKKLLQDVKEVHVNETGKYEEIKNAIAANYQESDKLTEDQVSFAAGSVAHATVQALLKIDPEDIEELVETAEKNHKDTVEVEYFDPINMLSTLRNNTSLTETIPDTTIRNELIRIASIAVSDQENSEILVGNLAEAYLGTNTTYLLFPTLNKDRKKPEYDIRTKDDAEESVGKSSIRELEKYATISYLVDTQASYAGLDLSKKERDSIVIATNKRLALQKYIEQTLKNDAAIALGIQTADTISRAKERRDILILTQQIVSELQSGKDLNMAIIVGTAEIKQDTPLVSFSFGGGIGANLSPIARIIGENVFKKTIGKKLAGKATAFVAKKVGTKLVAGAAGTAVSGPVGIAATVISFGKDILSFFSRKLKEHPELLMLPVIGVGFALGLPGLVIGGFGGGLVLVAGGPAQAIGIAGAGISTVAAAFMSLLVAASIGPIIAVIVGIPLLTALIVFIINTGAYVVPLEGLGLGVGPIPTECTGDPGPAPQPAQPYVRGIYSYPVDNYPNTSYPCYHWDHEKAVDMWSTETHPPLVAYTDGVIENVTLGDPLGGKYIILAGDDGRFYYYAHTCHVYVNVGDRVTRGQTVATMDNTGNATDQHLHFAINSTSVFAGGSGDVCPQTDFEEKFGFGRCTDPLSNCI